MISPTSREESRYGLRLGPEAMTPACAAMLEAGSTRRCRTPQIEIICHRASIARNIGTHRPNTADDDLSAVPFI
jgi:hypothetical protein